MGSSQEAGAMDAVKGKFLEHLEIWPEGEMPEDLLDALENCQDPLPTELFDVDGQSIGGAHEWIGLSPGVTFADAVREIRHQAGIE